MANERKTENIVRAHFEQFNDILRIEEQLSDNPKIDKLLKTASKKGGGKGRPEFLITFSGNSDLIIVVECKAETIKHESSTKDKFSEYAVDGVLLYASYLSKEFDVLAIGVSGQTKQQLKVSHFLQLKNERKAVPIFGGKLLSGNDYLDGYLKSPEKLRQDYNTLLAFTKQLNDTLHSYKILESQRSLLISCILIALENKAFKTAYPLFGSTNEKDTADEKRKKVENASKELVNYLVDTVSNELKNANIKSDRLDNLNIQFGFIRTDTSLSTKKDVLKNLIKDIDDNINSFIKTHKYYDVLGQLYIEFLRYANSDKGLGIVLTPPHITELFSDLAGVNKNSIAYDNCAGTGGFLISAMKKMIEDAKGDRTKIKEIKLSQLFGVEYQAHIFALAVSNMYIHQDGKTNILNGSCFDEDIIQEIKAKKPTVGFLNPPYKGDKKKDIDELEFVLNNLECLVDGGTCVAIVSMSCALATKGKIAELKKQILQKHTLKAVLSMPNELFSDSEANTFTCIMVFTAHKPHPVNQKTYFGYYKEDGFVKRKSKGRIDLFGEWEAIKDKWIEYYRNTEEKAGFSVNRIIKATDEWTVETYLETDYKKLKESLFIDEIRKFVSFQILHLDFKSKANLNFNAFENKSYNLDIDNWKYFELKEVFTFEKCKCSNATELLDAGDDIYYVGAKKSDNGVMQKVELVENLVSNGNCIVFIGDGQGSVGYATYQPIDFIGSTTLTCGYNNFLNPYSALFIVAVLDLERFKYSFGRKYGKAQLMKAKIKLPEKKGKPDFEFMENYIKSLPYSATI